MKELRFLLTPHLSGLHNTTLQELAPYIRRLPGFIGPFPPPLLMSYHIYDFQNYNNILKIICQYVDIYPFLPNFCLTMSYLLYNKKVLSDF